MYEYKARVKRVIDGDTVEMVIDLGLTASVIEKLRLHGINAPEIRGPEREAGLAAKVHLANLLEENEPITIRTIKDRKGKYGRYLATIFGKDGINLNQKMVDDGYAVLKEY